MATPHPADPDSALARSAISPHTRPWVGIHTVLIAAAGACALVACSGGASNQNQAGWSPTGAEDGGTGQGEADDGNSELPGDDEGDEGNPDDGGEEGEGGDEGIIPQCEPGESDACLCPDGLHLGDQTCREDGIWGACEDCEGGPGESDDGMMDAAESGDDGSELPEEVCYPGADGSFNTCFPLHYFAPAAMPAGYSYPGGLGNDANYRDPVAFIDLEQAAADTNLAANFKLSEIAEAYKGRWAIVQPHAVQSLQALRDEVGAINVNSGYRSPDYNAGVDGATYSRHMYGDGFDLDPVSVGLATLETACTAQGGMLVEYNTHVHCDFRFDDASVEFFGPAPASMGVGAQIALDAELREDAEGVWTAPVVGFDEGEPRRRWQAFDAGGELVATGSGASFRPPADARSLEVRVGRVIDLVASL